jgi:hypothetical protein
MVARRWKPFALSLEEERQGRTPGTEAGDSVFGGRITQTMEGTPLAGGRSRLGGHESPKDPHPGESEP